LKTIPASWTRSSEPGQLDQIYVNKSWDTHYTHDLMIWGIIYNEKLYGHWVWGTTLGAVPVFIVNFPAFYVRIDKLYVKNVTKLFVFIKTNY
jgi:hypothetical protein